MAKGRTGRPRGRPRKNSPAVVRSQPEDLTQVSEPVTHPVSRNETVLERFGGDVLARIRSCEEVYLVTKNEARLEGGRQDKQVHRAEWLKEVL